MMQDLINFHIFSCFFMTGLIWLIQLVSYPSFLFVEEKRFLEFHHFHSSRISLIVSPVMSIELISAAGLALFMGGWLWWTNAVGVVLIWLSTAFLSVPLHGQLGLGKDINLIRKLVQTNWPRTVLWSVRSIVFVFIFFSGAAMAIEEPKFEVLKKNADYEIRKYGPVLVAETTVDAGFKDAGNQAFQILAGYIFGKNKAKTKMEMTAPVTQQAPAEKIEMTAPVTMSKAPQGYVVQFVMPANYTRETLPEPDDKRVEIREMPDRKVAVFSYSGSWSESRYKEMLSKFRAALERDQVSTKGEPIFSRFNSPFALWFLRRNEIWIEVSE